VLDVAIAYADPAAPASMRRVLTGAGYEDRGDQGDHGGVVFVKGPPTRRTHHLHLVASGSAQWQRYLAFRDALRRDQSLRERYSALKEELVRRRPRDRDAYTDGKDELINSALVSPAATGAASPAHSFHGLGTDASHAAR